MHKEPLGGHLCAGGLVFDAVPAQLFNQKPARGPASSPA